jgi:hypothetical protein
MATTTTLLDRLRDAVEDLRHALSDIEYELDKLEDDDEVSPDAKACECRHLRRWHESPDVSACLSPDCPCRKFEPAGGAA